jgi:hypothetical protein
LEPKVERETIRNPEGFTAGVTLVRLERSTPHALDVNLSVAIYRLSLKHRAAIVARFFLLTLPPQAESRHQDPHSTAHCAKPASAIAPELETRCAVRDDERRVAQRDREGRLWF